MMGCCSTNGVLFFQGGVLSVRLFFFVRSFIWFVFPVLSVGCFVIFFFKLSVRCFWAQVFRRQTEYLHMRSSSVATWGGMKEAFFGPGCFVGLSSFFSLFFGFLICFFLWPFFCQRVFFPGGTSFSQVSSFFLPPPFKRHLSFLFSFPWGLGPFLFERVTPPACEFPWRSTPSSPPPPRLLFLVPFSPFFCQLPPLLNSGVRKLWIFGLYKLLEVIALSVPFFPCFLFFPCPGGLPFDRDLRNPFSLSNGTPHLDPGRAP